MVVARTTWMLPKKPPPTDKKRSAEDTPPETPSPKRPKTLPALPAVESQGNLIEVLANFRCELGEYLEPFQEERERLTEAVKQHLDSYFKELNCSLSAETLQENGKDLIVAVVDRIVSKLTRALERPKALGRFSQRLSAVV